MTDTPDTPEMQDPPVDPTPYVQISDKDGNVKNADDVTSKPTDRSFRDAWSLSGTVITEDLDAAKDIFKDKIREVRKPLLEAEDTVFMKALEDDDATAKANSKTKKDNLRDAPAATAISSATTIDELKAAWDSNLLGTSPYAQVIYETDRLTTSSWRHFFTCMVRRSKPVARSGSCNTVYNPCCYQNMEDGAQQ